MNRYVVCIALSAFFLFNCSRDYSGYIINGKIDDVNSEMKIYLKNDHSSIVEDSTTINSNGSFNFEGVVEYPQRYSIVYQTEDKQYEHPVWVENTNIEITWELSDVENIVINGGREQELSEEMSGIWDSYYPEFYRLVEETKYDSIETLNNRYFGKNLDFAIKHANSFMGIESLYEYRAKISKDSLRSILSTLDTSILDSNYGQTLSRYSSIANLNVGDTYADFTAKTFSGQEITISEVLKKEKPIMLVMGGFSCMQEHGRELLHEFHTNHKESIEIISVFFTNNLDHWEFERNYPLDVPLISDMEGNHSQIKIQYDIQATPTIYILDKDGIITWKSEGYYNKVNEAAKELISNS